MSHDNLREEYEKICQDVLNEEHLRFCGLISGKGELITGGFRDGVTPLENDEDQKKMFQELAVRVSHRKNFDSKMGRVKYSASRREYLVMMSFPIGGNILLVTAEPHVNIDRLAFRIIEKMGQQWYDFYGL